MLSAFKNNFAFSNLADLLSFPAWDVMNQYYIIITSTYKNIIRMLNFISMLWKSHIHFNQLPAQEKEVVTYWESRKGSKFLRVAWNDSQESNSGNLQGSQMMINRQSWEWSPLWSHKMSISAWGVPCVKPWSRVWRLGHGLEVVWAHCRVLWTHYQKAAQMGCVKLNVFINYSGESRQVGWIWDIQRKCADGPVYFCSCIWPACRNWTPKDNKKKVGRFFKGYGPISLAICPSLMFECL